MHWQLFCSWSVHYVRALVFGARRSLRLELAQLKRLDHVLDVLALIHPDRTIASASNAYAQHLVVERRVVGELGAPLAQLLLERLDNRYIQALLREVDGESLVRALKTAPDGLKEKILGNMSARASQIIMEDLESRGPMRVSEVTAAQGEIVRIALQMEQEGRIEFAAGGDDALV